MKSFTILSGVASILGLLFAIPSLSHDSLVAKLYAGAAVLALAACAFLAYRVSRLQRSVIPNLVHLKGACAATNEISKLASSITATEFDTVAAKRIIKQLIASAESRVRQIAGKDQSLIEAGALLSNLSTNLGDFSAFQTACKRARELVHEVDQHRLQSERVLSFVYHAAS